MPHVVGLLAAAALFAGPLSAQRHDPPAILLTPDRVFDHFRPRLQERSETRRLAEAVVPYWERAVEEVFEAPQDRALALRAAKLLCLLAASPLERPRTAGELAHMLLARLSTLDAEANVAFFEQAVLQPLAARGAYVVARPGPPRSSSGSPTATWPGR